MEWNTYKSSTHAVQCCLWGVLIPFRCQHFSNLCQTQAQLCILPLPLHPILISAVPSPCLPTKTWVVDQSRTWDCPILLLLKEPGVAALHRPCHSFNRGPACFGCLSLIDLWWGKSDWCCDLQLEQYRCLSGWAVGMRRRGWAGSSHACWQPPTSRARCCAALEDGSQWEARASMRLGSLNNSQGTLFSVWSV